jgi:hypothetical protein
MNWQLFIRAIFLRGGIIWLVATYHRVLPRKLPGPSLVARWGIRLNAKRQGRRDGKLGLPTAPQMESPERDFPAHLMYLKNRGDFWVRAILEAMLKVDTRKGGRSAAISHVRQLINRVIDERDSLSACEKELETQQAILQDRRQEYERNRDALTAAKKARRSAEAWNRGLPRRTYVPLLLALTLAELPLLALAFQNFFSVGFSIIVSLGVSVAIVFCAHVAGVILTKRESVLLPGDTVILTAVFGGVLATIVGLSFVRELYLQTTDQASGVSTGPTWVVVVVFAVFNVMVFGAAVLVSKFRHSELAERLDDARFELRQSKKQIKKARKQERSARREVVRSQDRIVILDGLASSTAKRARTSVEQARLAATARKDFVEECFALYVRDNARSQAGWAARRARLRNPLESGPMPAFNHLPEVKDPAEEFRPFEEQLRLELAPLEALLSHIKSTTPVLQPRGIEGAASHAPSLSGGGDLLEFALAGDEA